MAVLERWRRREGGGEGRAGAAGCRSYLAAAAGMWSRSSEFLHSKPHSQGRSGHRRRCSQTCIEGGREGGREMKASCT